MTFMDSRQRADLDRWIDCDDSAHDAERYGSHAYRNEDGELRVPGCESCGSRDPRDESQMRELMMCGACCARNAP